MKNNESIDKKTTYFFVRHGQTDWNVQGKIQGHTDIPLNDTGRQQAAQLKKMLEDTHFSACFSSDLQRASETASIVVEDRPIEIVKETRLRERHYGDFQGKSSKEYEASTVEQRVSLEQKEDLRKRIEAFLVDKSQQIEHPGNVLIVTHGGFISSVLAIILNIPFDTKKDIGIDNAAYVQMYFSGSEWVVEKTVGITLLPIK
jgi:broad specificity phosphatase PhoE